MGLLEGRRRRGCSGCGISVVIAVRVGIRDSVRLTRGTIRFGGGLLSRLDRGAGGVLRGGAPEGADHKTGGCGVAGSSSGRRMAGGAFRLPLIGSNAKICNVEHTIVEPGGTGMLRFA